MLDFALGELALKPWEFWRLTWGEYYRMVRGYGRRVRYEQTNIGKVLYLIETTKPRAKTQPAPKLEDYIPQENPTKPMSEVERKERAQEALENAKRFDKGVVKTTL